MGDDNIIYRAFGSLFVLVGVVIMFRWIIWGSAFLLLGLGVFLYSYLHRDRWGKT